MHGIVMDALFLNIEFEPERRRNHVDLRLLFLIATLNTRECAEHKASSARTENSYFERSQLSTHAVCSQVHEAMHVSILY
jgi:hypothetical protein